MHSSVKRLAPCTKPYHNEQTLHTYCYSQILLLYFIPYIVARLEEAEAPCFMKNASGSSKSQMLQSSLPVSFFKVFPLSQKFNCFHIPGRRTNVSTTVI